MAYTQQKKDEVLALLVANQGNVNKTSRQAGVNRQTIVNWEREAKSSRGNKSKEEVIDALKIAIVEAFGSLDSKSIAKMKPNEKIRLIGVFVDKWIVLEQSMQNDSIESITERLDALQDQLKVYQMRRAS